MANIASARKRARQAIPRRAHNMALRSRMRTHVKKVEAAIAAGDKESAVSSYQATVSMLDNSAGKGLIHANKAARYKSRLNARIRAMYTQNRTKKADPESAFFMPVESGCPGEPVLVRQHNPGSARFVHYFYRPVVCTRWHYNLPAHGQFPGCQVYNN